MSKNSWFKKLLKKIRSWIFKENTPKLLPVQKKQKKTEKYKNKVKKTKVSFCLIAHKTNYFEKDARQEANKRTTKYLKIRVYRCPHCEYWHLTHKKNKLNFH